MPGSIFEYEILDGMRAIVSDPENWMEIDKKDMELSINIVNHTVSSLRLFFGVTYSLNMAGNVLVKDKRGEFVLVPEDDPHIVIHTGHYVRVQLDKIFEKNHLDEEGKTRILCLILTKRFIVETKDVDIVEGNYLHLLSRLVALILIEAMRGFNVVYGIQKKMNETHAEN